MKKGYIQTDLGQIHYLHAGLTSRPPLILLHHCTSSAEMFRDLMEFLGRDFSVYAPDLPGFGATDQFLDRVTIKGYAQAVTQFMNTLKLAPCLVFGHYTGAAIAVQLASASPERVTKLVLSSPPSLAKDGQARFKQLLASSLPVDENGLFLGNLWQELRRDHSDIPIEISLRDFHLTLSAGELSHEVFEAAFSHNILDLLKRLDQPTLVTAGRNDPMFPYLDMALGCIKRGKKVAIGDASSYVCETHTRDLASIIFEFWRSQSSTLTSSQTEVNLQLT